MSDAPAPYCLVLKNIEVSLKVDEVLGSLKKLVNPDFEFELLMDSYGAKNRRVGLLQTRSLTIAQSVVNLHGTEFFGKCLGIEPNYHKYKGVFKKY